MSFPSLLGVFAWFKSLHSWDGETLFLFYSEACLHIYKVPILVLLVSAGASFLI